MGTALKSIGDLLDKMDRSELILPEIQRDFVWDRKSVLLLFDSLYRGLPIGYMLVWKARRAVASKSFKRSSVLRAGQKIDRMYGYLLDGQQRLTAIQLVRDAADEFPLMFSLRITNEEDIDSDRFFYRRSRDKYDNLWCVSVSDVLTKQIDPFNLIDELSKEEGFNKKRDRDRIYAELARLKEILKLEIGLIEYEDDDYQKATQLFIRFNSTGKRLKSSDLIAADLALSVPSLVSEHIIKAGNTFAKKYNFNFTKPFLIQCLAAVFTHRADFKRDVDIWSGVSTKKIVNAWIKTEKGIARTIEFITGTIKWESDVWLPSINALIPLVYIFANHKLSSGERSIARKWLHQACVHGAFSGSVYSELERLLRGLSKECSIQKLLSLSKKKIGRISDDIFNTTRRSGPAMALFISYLREKDARDWKTKTPLDGTVTGHNAELQIHHFFPRALLKQHGYSTEEINTFANYTIISKDTNLDIMDDEPADYIKKHKIRKADLLIQAIPSDESLWRVNNYKRFIRKRRELLAKETNRFLEGM